MENILIGKMRLSRIIMLRESGVYVRCCGMAPNSYKSNCDSRGNKSKIEIGMKLTEEIVILIIVLKYPKSGW